MILMFILAAIGVLADIWFITKELAAKWVPAVILKGLASAFFVAVGAVAFVKAGTGFGKLILIGLVLGMIGDIFLNLKNLFKGKGNKIVFALGILAFLTGHVFYIIALFKHQEGIVLFVLLATAVLAVVSIPLLMKHVTPPSAGFKYFAYVYLTTVICMFSTALAVFIKSGCSLPILAFVIGAALFAVSDFVLCYNFGKDIKPLRATNLTLYYIGQILIAFCIYLIR